MSLAMETWRRQVCVVSWSHWSPQVGECEVVWTGGWAGHQAQALSFATAPPPQAAQRDRPGRWGRGGARSPAAARCPSPAAQLRAPPSAELRGPRSAPEGGPGASPRAPPGPALGE